ncbi:MAG: hypothetical protein F6K31_06745 [Symploca sp. SIO2G7]|nr:hypothetical protein [Symploca sp. SIO2G7]
MATTTTKAIPVDQFIKYAEGQRKTYQHSIAVFLAKLSALKSEKSIKTLCSDTLESIKGKSDSPNTWNVWVSAYRNSIRKFQADIELNDKNSFENPSPKRSTDATNGRTHYALKWLNLPKKVHNNRNDESKTKTDAQRGNAQPFDPFAVIGAAKAALLSTSYLEQAVAVEFLIGRRPTEVLKGQGFKLIGKYEIEFSGQLKKKQGEAKPYTIYTLTDAADIVDALVRLKRDTDVKELEDDTNKQIDSRRNSSMNAAVRRVYKGVLNPPVGEKKLSNKNLRAAYIQAAAILFRNPRESMSKFAERLMGHSSVVATVSYEDYVCLDDDGNELPHGQKRHELGETPSTPKVEKRATVHIDGELKERFDTYGTGTHKEKINQLLNDADRVKTLEAKVIELERQLRAMSDATVTDKPESRSSISATDWSQVSSTELKGSQAPGSAEEKIRRAIEAIRAYNEGKELRQMYRLSEANVRYLSGSRHGTIKAYFAAHPEVADYDKGYGFSVQHDRGKTPITEMIEW